MAPREPLSGRRRFLRRLAAGPWLGALGACGGGGDADPAAPLALVAVHALGLAWAASSINVSPFREQALLRSADGGFIVGGFDAAGDACLHRLGPAGEDRGSVQLLPRLPDALLADGHCSINLGRDAEDRLHAVFGAHDTEPLALALPMADVMALPAGAALQARTWARHLSYPQFYRVAGRMQLWFRADPASEVHRWTDVPADGSLPAASEPLLLPGSAERAYMNQLATQGEQVALSWMYRLVSDDDLVRNEGLGVAWSRDGGQTWLGPNGRPLTWPQRRGSHPYAVELPASRQPLNQCASRFGADGRLYLTWYARDAQGRHQITLGVFRHPGVLEEASVVSDNTVAFDLLGRGTLVLPLSRPQLVASARYVHVVYRQGAAMVVASRALAGGAWHRLRVPTEDLGAWEPALSVEHWERSAALVVHVQSVSQGERDTSSGAAPRPARLFVFRESVVA